MTEGKPKAKKKTWWVLTETDDLLTRHYSGPDKNRARDVSAKLLSEANPSKGRKVFVARLASLTVLSDSNLKASLPKDAF